MIDDGPGPRPRPMIDDELECGAPAVYAAICRRPLVTCEELEGTLPLCPIKIHLSIAWLCSRELLEPSPPLPPRTIAPAQEPPQRSCF